MSCSWVNKLDSHPSFFHFDMLCIVRVSVLKIHSNQEREKERKKPPITTTTWKKIVFHFSIFRFDASRWASESSAANHCVKLLLWYEITCYYLLHQIGRARESEKKIMKNVQTIQTHNTMKYAIHLIVGSDVQNNTVCVCVRARLYRGKTAMALNIVVTQQVV